MYFSIYVHIHRRPSLRRLAATLPGCYAASDMPFAACRHISPHNYVANIFPTKVDDGESRHFCDDPPGLFFVLI